MKISIITALYNRAETIGQTIESVQSQTYHEVEHIIQDGGSTDGSLEIARRLASAGTRIFSETDRGIYDAINRGIARATGDLYQVPMRLTHGRDSFPADFVIHRCRLKEVCNGRSDWGSRGLFCG